MRITQTLLDATV